MYLFRYVITLKALRSFIKSQRVILDYMQRKAQFYVFDAFFAALILLLGVGLLIGEYSSTPKQAQTQALTFDIEQALTANQIQDLFTEYIQDNRDILEPSYTPAQQIQVWWHNDSCTWCMNNASELVQSMVSSIQPGLHGFNITIQNDTNSETIYTSLIDREAQLMIVNQQIIIAGDYGPDILEVRVWK
jgi:uncharacterized membrane protein YcjF (UPF0283 family)